MQPATFQRGEVEAILHHLADEVGPGRPGAVRIRDEHSNVLAEVSFPDGRTLMVKRARYAQLSQRFDTSRVAASLLHERTDVLAPTYLSVDHGVIGAPVLVYWRLDLPTLEDIWPELDAARRRQALRSWGHLSRRIHDVRLPGCGPLRHARREFLPLRTFLKHDLEDRLLPSVARDWSGGERVASRLLDTLDEADRRTERRPNVLVHGDLFAANVLCSRENGHVHCRGVIDFEDAFAGPPAAELARTEILHGPLFGRHWQPGWFDTVLEGYDAPPEPALMSYFRAYHMLNMGFHAVQTGLRQHADDVARAADAELDQFGSGRSHEEVLAGVGLAG